MYISMEVNIFYGNSLQKACFVTATLFFAIIIKYLSIEDIPSTRERHLKARVSHASDNINS